MNSIKPSLSNLKQVFLFSFVLVLILKCFNLTIIENYVPYSIVYFGYILFWLLLIFPDIHKQQKKIKLNNSFKVLIALFVYYTVCFLFGNKNINYSDQMNNYIREILLLLFIYVSIYWIERFSCLSRLIKAIYLSFFFFLILWFIIYFKEIDIIRTLSSFWKADGDLRYRINFGYKYNNLAAEMALSTIILSKKISMPKFWKRVINLFLLFIIVANNSRGTLVLFFITELLFFFFKKKKISNFKFNKLLWSGVILAVFLIGFYCIKSGIGLFELFSFTNRQGVTENIRIIEATNKWLFGLGRYTGGYFAERNYMYGYQTGYLEIFYFEILVTSGIIGSLFIIVLLKKFTTRLSKIKYNDKWLLIVMIYCLLISFFEVYLFSYIYASSMFFFVVMLLYIDSYEKWPIKNVRLV